MNNYKVETSIVQNIENEKKSFNSLPIVEIPNNIFYSIAQDRIDQSDSFVVNNTTIEWDDSLTEISFYREEKDDSTNGRVYYKLYENKKRTTKDTNNDDDEEWKKWFKIDQNYYIMCKTTFYPIEGSNYQIDDSVYEGMEVEAETVIGKTIKSNMCFILIDKEKSIVDNVEDYVRKPENEEKLRNKDDFDVSDEANFVQNPATFMKMFQGYDKIIANTTAFMDMQRKYHVSAAFAACVTIAESSGGTNWSAISESTHNWFSIKGDYNGQSQGGWRSYPSYAAAVDDFGDLIANSSNYYKAGKHTVNQIGHTYCSSEWSKTVNDLMKKAYDKANAR